MSHLELRKERKIIWFIIGSSDLKVCTKWKKKLHRLMEKRMEHNMDLQTDFFLCV